MQDDHAIFDFNSIYFDVHPMNTIIFLQKKGKELYMQQSVNVCAAGFPWCIDAEPPFALILGHPLLFTPALYATELFWCNIQLSNVCLAVNIVLFYFDFYAIVRLFKQPSIYECMAMLYRQWLLGCSRVTVQRHKTELKQSFSVLWRQCYPLQSIMDASK